MAHLVSLLLAVTVLASGATLHLVQGAATCEQDSDCSLLEGSICTEGACACPAEYFPDKDYTRCLPPSVDSSSACEAATQCASRLGLGVVCTDSVCRCGAGTHYLRGACHQSRGLGEACTSSDDCFDNYDTHTLTCDNGVCACATGAYSRYGVCRLKARGAGDACDYDEDCSNADATLSCVENICTNKAAAFTVPVKTNAYIGVKESDQHVRSVVAANTACEQETDCDATETCSVLKTCACKVGYFRDTDGVCKLELGMTCTEDADCSHIAEARCGETDSSRGKVCHCGPRWAPDPVNNYCRLARKMNYSCAVGANCFSFGHGTCEDYKCACEDGFRYIEERSFCWPIKALGDECTENLDCYYDNSICSNGVCGCISGYHSTSTGTCIKDVEALGDACENSTECSSVIPNSGCNPNTKLCTCSMFFIQTGPKECSVGINGKCTTDEDCSAVPGTKCDGKYCRCGENTTQSAAKDACLDVATEVGAPCREAVQCTPLMGKYATCNQTTGSCACLDGMHFEDGDCWNKTALGESCARSSECYVTGSRDGLECRNGLCKCKFDYVAADDNSACVSGATSGLRVGASTSALLLLALSLLRNYLC